MGDNLDKNVKARDVRAYYQGRSLCFFQMYAKTELTSPIYLTMALNIDISTICMKDVLPTSADQNALYTISQS